MHLEIGTDIVDVKDFSIKIRRTPGLLNRIFNKEEIDDCKNNLITLAGRFAAKEACIKALINFSTPVNWKLLKVSNRSNGQPQINLDDSLISHNKINEFKLSISHNKSYAIAIVVILFR